LNKTDTMDIYVIFRTFGEGDHCVCFSMETIVRTKAEVKDWTSNYLKSKGTSFLSLISVISDKMTKENNFTLFGKREEFEGEELGWGDFGGFIVEKWTV